MRDNIITLSTKYEPSMTTQNFLLKIQAKLRQILRAKTISKIKHQGFAKLVKERQDRYEVKKRMVLISGGK